MAFVHILNNITSSLPKRATVVEPRSISLRRLARNNGLDPKRRPIVCSHNGRWISQTKWHRVSARDGDVVVFIVMPQSDGARVAATLGILVLAAVVAPFLAAPIAGLLGGGAIIGGVITAVTTAALVIGANYLLNVLIPVKPAGNLGLVGVGSSASSGSGGGIDAAPPTYAGSLSAQNNVARLGNPIPALYGRLRFVPDLASAPWAEWIDRGQVLHQVLMLSQGEIETEKIEIGQTDSLSFDNVNFTLYLPGTAVNIFEPEVFTSTQVLGIELPAPNDPALGGFSVDEWSATVFYFIGDVVWRDQGGIRTYYAALLNNIGNDPLTSGTNWTFVVFSSITYVKGPFIACPPGRTIEQIGVDLSLPSGLYELNTGTGALDSLTIEWRFLCQEIDDSGNPLSDWQFLDQELADSGASPLVTAAEPNSTFLGGTYNYTGERSRPVTFSFRINLPFAARWQIKAKRLDDKILTGSVGHDLHWDGLRGFLETARGYGDCTMLAVTMFADRTNSINSVSSRQIAVTGTRLLPIWNGVSWSAPTATRNIAWAVADMLKNTTYGGKLDDVNFDLAGLAALAAIWDSRGDTFDFYSAQNITLWSALGLALRAGRTVPYHQYGIVRFHRDQPQTIPTMLFSSENIIKGSFAMQFILPSPEDETDSLRLDFLNEVTWINDSETFPQAGVTDPQTPSVNQFDGVVQPDQIDREGQYLLAADRYRRVLLSWDTELEGLIASRGDLILVHHDMPRWGQSTRVYDYDAGTKTVTLWGRLDFSAGGIWFAYFRDRRSRASAAVQIASYALADDALMITLSVAPTYPDTTPFDMTATRSEPLHIVVGQSDQVPRQAIFLGAVPRSAKIVSITAVLEDSRVHVN
jgi:hypothetical protein